MESGRGHMFQRLQSVFMRASTHRHRVTHEKG
jgi:hypothetical protein